MEGSDYSIRLGNKIRLGWTHSTSGHVEFRTENWTQHFTKANQCAMHIPAALRYVFSTIIGWKITFLARRKACHTATEWRNWGRKNGSPYAAESKGRQNEYCDEAITFLRLRYLKLLSQIKSFNNRIFLFHNFCYGWPFVITRPGSKNVAKPPYILVFKIFFPNCTYDIA